MWRPCLHPRTTTKYNVLNVSTWYRTRKVATDALERNAVVRGNDVILFQDDKSDARAHLCFVRVFRPFRVQAHFAKFFERSATSRLCTSSVIPYLSSKSGQAGTMSTVGEVRYASACVCAIVCPYIPVSACLCVRAHMLSRGPLPTQRLLKTWTRWGLSPGPPAC